MSTKISKRKSRRRGRLNNWKLSRDLHPRGLPRYKGTIEVRSGGTTPTKYFYYSPKKTILYVYLLSRNNQSGLPALNYMPT